MSDPSERLLTTNEAAEVTGRTPSTIRTWVHRGWLRPYVTDRGRRHLFLELDVLLVERDTRRRDMT